MTYEILSRHVCEDQTRAVEINLAFVCAAPRKLLGFGVDKNGLGFSVGSELT